MPENEFECASVLTQHTQDVKRVQWHPREEICASCSYDNTVQLYREQEDDWASFCTLEGHESTVWGLSFDKSGRRLVSCSDDKTLRIWEQKPDDETYSCVSTLSGFHERAVYDVSWCHETGLIASAGGDDTVCVFREDLASEAGDPGNKKANFSLVSKQEMAHSNDVNSVHWNPKVPGLLASCGDDGLVKLWTFKSDHFSL
jgi:WD40 repeat protein